MSHFKCTPDGSHCKRAAPPVMRRLVRGARVEFVLSDGRVVDADPRDDGPYVAQVGSAAVSSVRVVDDCGNSA